MTEKKKFKFNIVDAIVAVVILAALIFAAYKVVVEPNKAENLQSTTYVVSYYCEEVPTFAAEAINIGDPISDESKDVPLGTVTAVEIEPSSSYATDAQGNIHKTAKEGYQTVKLTTEVTVQGEPYQHGIAIGSSKYGVGHSITIRAGKAKIFGRVSGIDLK